MNAVSRLTAKELNLAARTVFAEAATEGLNGQMAVAQTMYDQLPHNIIGADGSGFLQIITCISLCLTEEAATGEITGIPTT